MDLILSESDNFCIIYDKNIVAHFLSGHDVDLAALLCVGTMPMCQ